MSEIEIKKRNIVSELRALCAHCATSSSRPHNCPVREIALRVQNLHGVPLVVGGEFKGILWT